MISEGKEKIGKMAGNSTPVRFGAWSAFGILVCLWVLWPQAGAYARPSGTFAGARSVPDEVLDGMRGGFFFGDAGFNFSFRSVTWINNVFQAETDLTLANNIITSVKNTLNTAHVFPGSTIGTVNSGSSGNSVTTATSSLIQVGSGNSVSGNTFSNASGITTVIQNNANNVVIQHLTQINGTVITGGAVTHSANMVYRFGQSATLGSIISRF
ncbi:MAG: hypothetical protein VST70_00340 [Nitrospirota bacterium]|nr:hypothetical protein [Nitrospirota bacterium]